MDKKITGVLIDVDNGNVSVETLDGSLAAYYKALNCELIDITPRRIGKRRTVFNIVCDDEGLYKEKPKISAISDMGEPMLVGNLFIVGVSDDEGNLTSLTDKEAKYVTSYVAKQATHKYPEPYPMLHMCEY